MRVLVTNIQNLINAVLQFFYPLVKKFMPYQLYSYAACGSFATVVDIVAYYIAFNYILAKQNLNVGFATLSSHVAAVLLAFLVSFPIGFFLQKYITFTGSTLRGRVQLLRYLSIVVVCIMLNIIGIKLLVENYHLYPTVSKIITTIFVVAFSYFTQRHFSFSQKKTTAAQ